MPYEQPEKLSRQARQTSCRRIVIGLKLPKEWPSTAEVQDTNSHGPPMGQSTPRRDPRSVQRAQSVRQDHWRRQQEGRSPRSRPSICDDDRLEPPSPTSRRPPRPRWKALSVRDRAASNRLLRTTAPTGNQHHASTTTLPQRSSCSAPTRSGPSCDTLPVATMRSRGLSGTRQLGDTREWDIVSALSRDSVRQPAPYRRITASQECRDRWPPPICGPQPPHSSADLEDRRTVGSTTLQHFPPLRRSAPADGVDPDSRPASGRRGCG